MTERQADRRIATTRRELAEIFQVQLKTVDYWQQCWKRDIPDCPCATRHYDVLWVAEWILTRPNVPVKVKRVASEVLGRPFTQFGRGKGQDGSGDGNGEGLSTLDLRSQLLQEQVRHEREKADAVGRKNRIAEQDLVSLIDVRRAFSEWFTYIRALIQRLPREIQPGLPEEYRRQIVDEIQERVDLMLRAIYAQGVRIENLQSSDE